MYSRTLINMRYKLKNMIYQSVKLHKPTIQRRILYRSEISEHVSDEKKNEKFCGT